MTRLLISAALASVLAGCIPPAVPESGAPFDAQTTTGLNAPTSVESQPLDNAPGVEPAARPLPSSITSAVDGDDAAARNAAAAANSGQVPLDASPSNPAPEIVENAGISSEQDFESVSGQRSIQSDADRIRSNRAQYTVIEPEALPTRPGTDQPNIVAYALQTDHPVGTQLYRRVNIASAQRHTTNCARYPSPDQAQIAFLSMGGPARDRKSLDPDGDGYACGWNPAPFRAARANAAPAAPPAQISDQPAPAAAPASANQLIQPGQISSESSTTGG